MYFPNKTKLRLADAETSYITVCKKYLTELQNFCGPYLKIEIITRGQIVTTHDYSKGPYIELYLHTVNGGILQLQEGDIIVKTDLTIQGKSEIEQLKVYSSKQFEELYYSHYEYINNSTWEDENASEPIENEEETECGCKHCSNCNGNNDITKKVNTILGITIDPKKNMNEEEKAQFKNIVSEILKIVQN